MCEFHLRDGSGTSYRQPIGTVGGVRGPDGGVAMILVTPKMVFKSNKLKAEMPKLEEQNQLG